jgi:hypothetical protein
MVNYMKVVQGFDATEFNRNHRGFMKEKFIWNRCVRYFKIYLLYL